MSLLQGLQTERIRVTVRMRTIWRDRMQWLVEWLNRLLEQGYKQADIETGV